MRSLQAWIILACLVAAVRGGVAAGDADAPEPAAPGGAAAFFDDFNGGAIDDERWEIIRQQWGGADVNGGVVPDNVALRGGHCVITARGDRYAGPVRGIHRDGSLRDTGARTGGAIATRERLHYGRYEVRLKPVLQLGTYTAMWTFHWEAGDESDPAHRGPLNHEIDIEMPGRSSSLADDSGFDRVLCNTFVGEAADQRTLTYNQLDHRLDDGAFHTFRFDWLGPRGDEPARVDFYIDGELVRTITTHVPSLPGRFWVGCWFPPGWSGEPDFDTDTMAIDWVRYTPMPEAPESD